MNPKKQKELMEAAMRAVIGSGQTITVMVVAEALELEYRRGLSIGYDTGYEDGLSNYEPNPEAAVAAYHTTH